MMVHYSMLLVAAGAAVVLTLVILAFSKEGPDEGEYLSRIHDLECRLATCNTQKSAYKMSYDALCRIQKYGDIAGEGARRIIQERIRQKVSEGWTQEHDAHHLEGQLSVAAACYAVHGVRLDDSPISVYIMTDGYVGDAWPWDDEWDKRKKHTRMRRLEIAGALIAAEIDRLVPNISPNKKEAS